MNALVYGMQQEMIQRMLDYDYLCGNQPSVCACVGEGGTASSLVCHWGREMLRIPVYRSLDDAMHQHPTIDTCINAASLRTATSVIRQCF
jgi:ATP citrate (pro-S)-lyase